MLGSAQKSWFKRAVPKSKADWKLWGSEVMVMSLQTAPGTNANHDQWDGYGAERQEILDSFVAAGVKNFAALTGDIHTFFAGNLYTTGVESGTPVGVELVGGSATSFGLPEQTGIPSSTLTALAPADPHLKYFDFDHRGYMVVEASKHELSAEFKSVDAFTKGAKPVSLKKFKVASGSTDLQLV